MYLEQVLPFLCPSHLKPAPYLCSYHSLLCTIESLDFHDDDEDFKEEYEEDSDPLSCKKESLV